jgi:hypothetical protein
VKAGNTHAIAIQGRNPLAKIEEIIQSLVLKVSGKHPSFPFPEFNKLIWRLCSIEINAVLDCEPDLHKGELSSTYCEVL